MIPIVVLDHIFKDVGKGTMAKVVAQPGDGYESSMLFRDDFGTMELVKMFHALTSQVVNPEGVGEAGVRRGGEHREHKTRLTNQMQSLKFGRVDDPMRKIIHVNGSILVTVDRQGHFCVIHIFHLFQNKKKTKI
jgi:hypothetical protein